MVQFYFFKEKEEILRVNIRTAMLGSYSPSWAGYWKHPTIYWKITSGPKE
jgi:hypothetical protein